MNQLIHLCNKNNKILQSARKMLLASVVFSSRLGWLPGNFSPVGSFGFFGGAIWLYLAIVIGFDVLVGGLYSGFMFTYLGFLAYPLLGKFARENWKRQVVLLPAASTSFFLLSNLGVWWYWFPHTIDGLILCYTLALPFFARTIMGDFIFGYGYLLLRGLLHVVKHNTAPTPFDRTAQAAS
ncbi:MAG: DUF6580 family putative transport protein [Patescibacteria group bacterium]